MTRGLTFRLLEPSCLKRVTNNYTKKWVKVFFSCFPLKFCAGNWRAAGHNWCPTFDRCVHVTAQIRTAVQHIRRVILRNKYKPSTKDIVVQKSHVFLRHLPHQNIKYWKYKKHGTADHPSGRFVTIIFLTAIYLTGIIATSLAWRSLACTCTKTTPQVSFLCILGSLDVCLSASVKPKLSITLHEFHALVALLKRDSTFAVVASNVFPPIVWSSIPHEDLSCSTFVTRRETYLFFM